jgi:hypothetical protein
MKKEVVDLYVSMAQIQLLEQCSSSKDVADKKTVETLRHPRKNCYSRGVSRQQCTANVYGKIIVIAYPQSSCRSATPTGIESIQAVRLTKTERTSSSTPSKLRLKVTWNFLRSICCEIS